MNELQTTMTQFYSTIDITDALCTLPNLDRETKLNYYRTTMSAEAPTNSLSSYEQTRARNIERNNKLLRELGLISVQEEKKSNDEAWGLTVHRVTIAEPKDKENDGEWSPPSKKKRKSESKPRSSPVRKSARILGIDPEGNELSLDDAESTATNSQEERRRQRQAIVEECREARQRAALRVMEAGAEKAAKENPTATYEHCLMRVRTMTEKGLQNRVKAIERATGKHCVVKMAIFKSCLQDEDKWELAELASQALERLKGLQAPLEDIKGE